MTLVGTVSDQQCPEPLPVFQGSITLPGPAPDSLVAVYRGEEYEPARAPDAQTATPLRGSLTGNTVGGIPSVTDGVLLFAVVRYAPGTAAVLAVSASGRAWRDGAVQPGKAYVYRIQAERLAATSATSTRAVHSFPSAPGQGTGYDLTLPTPPAGSAVWVATDQVVRVTWTTSGLAPGMEILVQRMEQNLDSWARASGWIHAAAGTHDDPEPRSGRTYFYRLRVRDGTQKTSQDEPPIGRIAIP
jgi:hypothetical protein